MHSLTQPARDVRSSTSSTAEVSTTSITDLAQLSLSRPAAHAAIEASDEQAARGVHPRVQRSATCCWFRSDFQRRLVNLRLLSR